MTRWFHAAAAALFLLCVWASFERNEARPTADPKSQLIQLLGRSGLQVRGVQRAPGGESVFTLGLAACPSTLDLIYFPSLSSITPAQVARIEGAGAKATFIYDGETIGGLGALDLMRRWSWRRLLVAVRLRASEPWQSIALALLVPRNCATPAIDWRSLTRPK